MNNTSFDIATPGDFLAKFEAECADFKQSDASARHAINAFMTAYHLCDWVWAYRLNGDQSLQQKLGLQPASRSGFVAWLITICPDLETAQAIANGSKHFKAKQHSNPIATRKHRGAFSSAFSRDFDIDRLIIVGPSGEEDAEDVLDRLLAFWQNFFEQHL